MKIDTHDALKKFSNLKDYLFSLKKVAIAFSSGVDSTFLLKTAHDVLKENAIAITINSPFFKDVEKKDTTIFCQKQNIKHIISNVNILSNLEIKANPINRCYLCKKEIFTKIIEIAKDNCITNVCEGSNIDDLQDYRPGLKAINELNIISPLKKCNLTKNEIRFLSKKIKLETWNKPSFACLASRFVYNEELSKEKLLAVSKSEQFIALCGFTQFRVRVHSNLARIEILPSEFSRMKKYYKKISEQLHLFGFTYVTVDLDGYKTGSMNNFLF